jgi:heme oxygenase
VLDRLREATRQAHRRIEGAVGLGPAPRRDQYVRYLSKQYGFLSSLEPSLDGVLAALGLDPAPRRKAHLAAQDLAALGVDPGTVRRCARVALPALDPAARALGCLYVMEGQTLGGRVLLRALRQPGAPVPAAFLDAYGDATGARWQELGRALEARARAAPDDVPHAVAGAIEAFERMQRWLELP